MSFPYNLLAVLPEVVILTSAALILVVDLFIDDERRHITYWLTQLALLIAACVTVNTVQLDVVKAFHNMVVDDMLADLLRMTSFVAVSLMLFYSRSYLLARGLFRGETFALATLVAARGSSYRRPGARMLICGDGITAGSLSGGCLEEEVVRRAQDTMRDGTPALMSFDTRLRFGCNGSIDIFVEPARDDFLSQLAANFSERRSCRALTIFAGDDLGTRLVQSDTVMAANAFVQEIEPAIRLLIFGEGPDSLPLRAFAEILGWELFEIDSGKTLRATGASATPPGF